MNRPVYPTFAAELLAARAGLTLPEAIGLALRAHRHHLHHSQRAYAAHRDWTQSRIARLETAAAHHRLADIIDALQGTGYRLALLPDTHGTRGTHGTGDTHDAHDTGTHDTGDTHDAGDTGDTGDTGDAPNPPSLDTPIPASHWPTPELIARVRGGRRRFPAHHTTRRTSTPPRWWLTNESTYSFNQPHWTTAPDFYLGWPPPESRPEVPAPSSAIPGNDIPQADSGRDWAGSGRDWAGSGRDRAGSGRDRAGSGRDRAGSGRVNGSHPGQSG